VRWPRLSGSPLGVVARKLQILLAVVFVLEAAFVIREAHQYAARIHVTSDGDVLPWPWTYPSPFSASAAFTAAVVVALVAFCFTPTRGSLVLSILVFLLGTVAAWSSHRFIVFFQGISHGPPGWW